MLPCGHKYKPMENEIKVIIADDHALFADGLEQIVHALAGFRVMGKATDGKQLMQRLNASVPDMILMDINMPHLNGMEAAQKILRAYPHIKIIFISMYFNGQLMAQAKELGAWGFLMKDVTAVVVKEAILNARDNIQTFLPPISSMGQQDAGSYKLSPREIDIIQLIKEGNTTKQIAALLELSVYTIETHRKNINRKLKVQSTAELVALMHQLHL